MIPLPPHHGPDAAGVTPQLPVCRDSVKAFRSRTLDVAVRRTGGSGRQRTPRTRSRCRGGLVPLSHAADRLPATAYRWWPLLGNGERSRVRVGDQRQRGGSCAPDGALRFNRQVMMLLPTPIEFIVIHELAQPTHQNHSPDVWALVAKAMSDTQHRRRRFRDAGRALPL